MHIKKSQKIVTIVTVKIYDIRPSAQENFYVLNLKL